MRVRPALFLALAAALASQSKAEEMQVVKSGKVYGSVDAFRAADAVYLEASDAARVYGGKTDTLAVSGKVLLSVRGRKAVFSLDSGKAVLDGKSVDLPRGVLARGGRAWVPVEFFQGREFSEASGFDTQFNAKTGLLSVDRRSSVGPMRWFTYPDHTRVVLELKEGLSFTSDRRGLRALDVSIPAGAIDWSEKVEISDGVVEYAQLTQESGRARFAVSLAAEGLRWTLKEFDKPRRLVLDVARTQREGGPGVPERKEAVDEPPEDGAEPSGEEESLPPAKIGPAEAARAAAAKQPKPPSPRRRMRIAIDAGHGGRDSGAVGVRGTLEKDINLSAARELERLLEEEGLFEVLLTRSSDAFLPLADRARIANEGGADLFISIHCNAHRSRSENGFEVYFLSERASDPEAERLAEFENSVLALEGNPSYGDEAAGVLYQMARTEFINDASELGGRVVRALDRRADLADRGVRQAGFYVLRGVNAPAILVEMGFLTHSRDEAKLESRKSRRKIVEGIYAGAVDFARSKGWLKGGGKSRGGSP
jgi:N-acetylmuramoyl-L-alanine amidase